jgi:hypothetical protein
MAMREERAGKRHKGDGDSRDDGAHEVQSPTVQEIAEFLNVEMSPRKPPLAVFAEDSRPENNGKHVVEIRTDQDNKDDGYRQALLAWGIV